MTKKPEDLDFDNVLLEQFNELESQEPVRDTLAECQAMPEYRDAVAAFAESLIAKGLNVEVLNRKGVNDQNEVEDYVQCEAWK